MAEVLEEQIPEIQKVTLEPGSGGVFEISVDAKLVFSKKKLRRFPEEDEAVRLVRQRAEEADATSSDETSEGEASNGESDVCSTSCCVD